MLWKNARLYENAGKSEWRGQSPTPHHPIFCKTFRQLPLQKVLDWDRTQIIKNWTYFSRQPYSYVEFSIPFSDKSEDKRNFLKISAGQITTRFSDLPEGLKNIVFWRQRKTLIHTHTVENRWKFLRILSLIITTKERKVPNILMNKYVQTKIHIANTNMYNVHTLRYESWWSFHNSETTNPEFSRFFQ